MLYALLILTIHCEVILRIRALRDDAEYLLLPKVLVKNAISMVGKKTLPGYQPPRYGN